MLTESIRNAAEASLLRIAPEKWDALLASEHLKRLSFTWTDTPSKLPSILVPSGEIRIPTPGANLLWATAYKYWVLYSEYTADQTAGDTTFDLQKTPRRLKAQQTFCSALARFTNPSISLPSFVPSSSDTHDDDVRVTNELFLAALAWILHHELAHLRCNHPPHTAISRQEESQADAEATTWIFSTVSDPAQRKKRALGMCVAILLLNAICLKDGNFDDSTHPKAFVRLYNCLELADLDDNHVAYAFCTLMIRVHMLTFGYLIPEDYNADSHLAIFSEHLVAIAQIQRAHK
jgi:hypothetical protein